MSQSLLERQSGLPRIANLFRYVPDRPAFDWRDFNPRSVRSIADLPPYLILGNLDRSSFQHSSGGWSARWHGKEANTHFDVTYKAGDERWEVSQTWRGINGGSSFYTTKMSLQQVIGQALYMQFPNTWDRAAKEDLEADYQLTVIEQPETLYTFCGIPDGAMRSIVFPIAVCNLRPFRQWLQESIGQWPLPYPVMVDARLLFQAVNYLEGKAPEWTSQEAVLFNQSVEETGLSPQGLPVRETANDGSSAWTLRREIYFVFIGLPFAGLTDFLERLSSETGPIRSMADPSLRVELRPLILPAGFEYQVETITSWDRERTTRSLIEFLAPGDDAKVPGPEEFIEREKHAAEHLVQIESISADIVGVIEGIFNQTIQGRN